MLLLLQLMDPLANLPAHRYIFSATLEATGKREKTSWSTLTKHHLDLVLPLSLNGYTAWGITNNYLIKSYKEHLSTRCFWNKSKKSSNNAYFPPRWRGNCEKMFSFRRGNEPDITFNKCRAWCFYPFLVALDPFWSVNQKLWKEVA